MSNNALLSTGGGATIPGSNTQVLTSDGAGGVTATGVTINPATNKLTTPGIFYVDDGTVKIKMQIYSGGLIGTETPNDFSIYTTNTVRATFGASLGFSVFTPTALIISDAATNTVVTPLTLTRGTSGTAAAGLGVAAEFSLPSAAGTLRSAGQISTVWTDATNGAEASVLKLHAMTGGAAGTDVTIDGGGYLTGLTGATISNSDNVGVALLRLKNSSNSTTSRGEFFDLVQGSSDTIAATIGHQDNFVFGDGTPQTFIASRIAGEPLCFIVGAFNTEKMRLNASGGLSLGTATDPGAGAILATGSITSLYDRFGTGSPEGVVTAPVGTIFHRTDGGVGTAFYIKQTGAGNTGWAAPQLLVDDTGWTANADAGDKTAVIPANATLNTIATALNALVSGAGDALANTAKKCKALETALAANLLPNA